MTIKAAGFIVYTDEAIFGIGRTARDALRDARKWLADGCTDSDVHISPATQALLDEIAAKGGAIAWGRVGDVRCTISEEEGACT